MPSVENRGGSIFADNDHDNYAAVTIAKATRLQGATGTWVVTLKDPPTKLNFTAGQALTYNSKGTRNPNADNQLTVTTVNGPAKYTCNGPYPIRI